MHTPEPESPKGCLDLARKLISLGWIIVKRVQRRYLNNEVGDKVNFVFYDVAEKTLEHVKLEWDKMYDEYKEWFSKKERLRDQIRNYEKVAKRMRKHYTKRDLLTKIILLKQKSDSIYTHKYWHWR